VDNISLNRTTDRDRSAFKGLFAAFGQLAAWQAAAAALQCRLQSALTELSLQSLACAQYRTYVSPSA